MKNLEAPRARWIKVRIGMLAALLGAGCVKIATAAYDLQVRRRDELHDMASAQYTRSLEIAPRRGTIYDRHGNPLAVSVASPSIAANPRRLRGMRNLDMAALTARIGAILGMPQDQVSARLSVDRGFVWLKRHVTDGERAAIRAMMTEMHIRDRDGMELVEESQRYYPNRELAAHVLGFVGADGHGLEGVEKALDEELRGHNLSVQGLRDARGNLVYADGLTPGAGVAGDDVTLTIDSTIQNIAERELARTAELFEARGGSVVVTDPATGEILAMASYPTYNPNAFQAADPDARRNRPVTDRFEPGSTMKVFSVAGALDAGVVQPGQLINCFGGTYTIGNLTIHDAHPETWLTPMQVLARSSNIGAAQIGAALGSDGLERTYRRFGFGERTGIPLPGEARARFGERRWYEVEVATVAFGQGIGVTSIQLAQGLGAVANGGRLVHPLLVRRVVDATGSLVQENVPDPGRPALSPPMARLVGEMLTTVTEEGGTGTEAALAGVRVAGKTGTAQKANTNGRGYDDTRWTSSFIGFVPANRPRLVITVVIDEPQVVHSGGTVSAPLFRRVAEQSLRYLGALPAAQRPLDRVQAPTPPRPAHDTHEEGSISSADGHRVNVTADAAGVPSLLGMSARAAVRTLSTARLDADLEGSGMVIRQDPEAGAPAPTHRRVHLWLQPGGEYTPMPAGTDAAPSASPSTPTPPTAHPQHP